MKEQGRARKRIRLLVLSCYYAPELTGNAAIVTGLTRELVSRGHDVTVLAGTPHYRLPRVPPRYRFGLYVSEKVDGVRVVRCATYPRSDGKVAKILNYCTYTLTSFLASPFVGRPDVVLAVTPPPWIAFVGFFLRFLFGSRVIYNTQDLFPEAYMTGDEIHAPRLMAVLEHLQQIAYRWSDRISVITPSFVQAIASKGLRPEKIVLVPNFIDTLAIEPRPKGNPFSERWGMVSRFVVMCAGNIGYDHDVELLVEVARRFATRPEILLAVVGDGSRKRDLERLATAGGVANLMLLAPQPNDVLCDLLASSDVLVLATKRGKGKTSFPSRLYSYMLAERPIVASIDPDCDAALQILSAECGFVVPPGEVDEFTRVIELLSQDFTRRTALGRNGREFVDRHLRGETMAMQYERIFHELTQQKPA